MDRKKRYALVMESNPRWTDLSAEWFDEEEIAKATTEIAKDRARQPWP
jgi:hypothetical protein